MARAFHRWFRSKFLQIFISFSRMKIVPTAGGCRCKIVKWQIAFNRRSHSKPDYVHKISWRRFPLNCRTPAVSTKCIKSQFSKLHVIFAGPTYKKNSKRFFFNLVNQNDKSYIFIGSCDEMSPSGKVQRCNLSECVYELLSVAPLYTDVWYDCCQFYWTTIKMNSMLLKGSVRGNLIKKD
jgi:hypothetical protein